MAEIALILFILISTAGILENILYIKDLLPRRYGYNEYGIGIVLDITWISICIVALLVGGSFASTVIGAVTVILILAVTGDLFACAKYKCISDGIGLAIHTVLLIMFLSI